MRVVFFAPLISGATAAALDDVRYPFPEGTEVISVNFGDGGTAMGAGADAGIDVPRKENWNNAIGDNGMLTNIVDHRGTKVVVNMTWSCQDEDATTITGGTPGDQTMMAEGARSWKEAAGGAGVNCTLVFSNLLSVFDAPYNLYVYIGRGGGWPDTSGNSFTLTAGTNALTGWTLAGFDGTWNKCMGGGDAGNWCVISCVEDTLQVDLVAGAGKTLNTAAINGLQLYGIKQGYRPGSVLVVR